MTYVVPALPRRGRDAFIDVPSRIARRTTAKSRGWFAGWPDNCPGGAARTSVQVTRTEDGRIFKVSVDKRLGVLFDSFLTFSMELGYPLIGATEVNEKGTKQGGVGSFSCRAIKGSNPPAPSNHSTGTALDLYTRSNPQRWGKDLPFVSTIHPNMVKLAAAADLYWGGWYWNSSRHEYIDAMHFEYMRRPSDVASSIERLRTTYRDLGGGSGGGGTQPKPPEPTEPEDDVTTEQIKVLQASLNAAGTEPPLLVDGLYGPATSAAVVNLSKTVARQVDLAEEETKAAAIAAATDAITGI